MPLYIKDEEVDRLATRLAGLRRSSKTEIVRLALQHELEREQGKPSLVDAAVSFARAFRARSNFAQGLPADKAFIDSLYEDGA